MRILTAVNDPESRIFTLAKTVAQNSGAECSNDAGSVVTRLMPVLTGTWT